MSSSSTVALSLVCAVALAMACTTHAQSAYLTAHNSARATVSVDMVSWDTTIATYAQNYANQRSGDCSLIPSGGSYGENLYWSYDAGATATDAVNSWVAEGPYYVYATNECQSGQVCRHYTQVVWNTTTSIGCGSVVCDNDTGAFFICNYDPARNIVGQRPY